MSENLTAGEASILDSLQSITENFRESIAGGLISDLNQITPSVKSKEYIHKAIPLTGKGESLSIRFYGLSSVYEPIPKNCSMKVKYQFGAGFLGVELGINEKNEFTCDYTMGDGKPGNINSLSKEQINKLQNALGQVPVREKDGKRIDLSKMAKEIHTELSEAIAGHTVKELGTFAVSEGTSESWSGTITPTNKTDLPIAISLRGIHSEDQRIAKAQIGAINVQMTTGGIIELNPSLEHRYAVKFRGSIGLGYIRRSYTPAYFEKSFEDIKKAVKNYIADINKKPQTPSGR